MQDSPPETPDRITEVLARAWIVCDPNRSDDPDETMEIGKHLRPGATLAGRARWEWFVPRALAMRDFLSEHGLVIRPKGTDNV